MSIFTKFIKHYSQESTPIYNCPHCGGKVHFDFKVRHNHKFDTKIETENLLENVVIKKDAE